MSFSCPKFKKALISYSILPLFLSFENGATAGKFDLAKRAKELNLDAIHDTVHEMARDEARHGKAFEGLLARYFG